MVRSVVGKLFYKAPVHDLFHSDLCGELLQVAVFVLGEPPGRQHEGQKAHQADKARKKQGNENILDFFHSAASLKPEIKERIIGIRHQIGRADGQRSSHQDQP